MDQNGRSDTGEKWPSSGCISQVAPIGFANGEMRTTKQGWVKDANKLRGLSDRKNSLGTNLEEENFKGSQTLEKDQELSLEHIKFEISIKHPSGNIE